MKRVLLPFFLLVFSLSSCDEEEVTFSGDRVFSRLYGGGGADVLSDMIMTSDGMLVIAGSTTTYNLEDGSTFGDNDSDPYLLLLDQNGEVLHEQAYADQGAGENELVNSVTELTDGSLVMAATVYEQSVRLQENYLNALVNNLQPQTSYIKLYKLTKEGTLLNSKQLTLRNASPQYAKVNKVLSTPDGGFLLVGSVRADLTAESALASQMLMLKLDAEMQVEFQRVYGFEGRREDSGVAAAIAPNGDYMWLGTVETVAGADEQLRLVRTDGLLNLKSDIQYREEVGTTAKANAILQDDGGFVLLGTQGFVSNNQQIVVRVNNQSQFTWVKTLSNSGGGYMQALCLSPDNNYIVTGANLVSNVPQLALKKVSQSAPVSGEQASEWEREYGAGAISVGRAVLPAPDGGYFVGGTIRFGNVPMILLIKTDSEGRVSSAD